MLLSARALIVMLICNDGDGNGEGLGKVRRDEDMIVPPVWHSGLVTVPVVEEVDDSSSSYLFGGSWKLLQYEVRTIFG
jgi:hypothetical protein